MMDIDAGNIAIGLLILAGWYAAGRLLMAAKLEPRHLAPLAKDASRTWSESIREVLGGWLLQRCHDDAEQIAAALRKHPWLRDMLNTPGHWLAIEHPHARDIAAKN